MNKDCLLTNYIWRPGNYFAGSYIILKTIERGERVRWLGPSERRQAIWEYLCSVRFDTTKHLANLFGVCERTIRSDWVALSCTYPIETSFGPYGGIRVSDWYHPGQRRLSPMQTSLLVKIRLTLDGEDLKVMNSILIQFALPGSY